MFKTQFPKGFLWGTATSAHQVEGNNTKNDWWEWEHSEKREKELRAAGLEPKDFQSGKACDHYRRFEEDFDLAASLGTNAHRFSIEWSRIEPEEGKFDQAELDHYRKVLVALRKRGLEPFVTLWHFTNPVWFSEIGGWESPKAVFYFSRFIARVAEEYRDLVRFWITLNEPNIYVEYAYGKGAWSPFKPGWLRASRALWRLAAAHIAAYRILHRVVPHAEVGIAHNVTHVTAARWYHPLDWMGAAAFRFLHNGLPLRLTRNTHDFLGINYYHRASVRFLLRAPFFCIANPNKWVNSMGWDIHPEGIYRVVKWAARYRVPMYITENGTADADDDHRARFIVEHLRWLKKAIDEGVDVRGYFHWSLLDNFEWTKGFAPRFGLFAVDYKTLERKRRPSADVYKKICETNSLPCD